MQLRQLLLVATCALSVAAADAGKMKCKPKVTPALSAYQAPPPATASTASLQATDTLAPSTQTYSEPASVPSESEVAPITTETSATTRTAENELPAPEPQPELTSIESAATQSEMPVEDAPAPAPQPEQPTEAPTPAPEPQPEPSTTDIVSDPSINVAITAAIVQESPAPVAQPVASAGKCSAENMPACALLVPFDNPPIELKTADVITQCVGLANYARRLYNPSAPPLVWSDALATRAKTSADYAAKLNCWNCHSDSGSGTDWGQNLYLSKGSCWDSYTGWVTDEALAPSEANPDQGHFKNVVGIAIAFSPYLSIGCGSSSIGSSATVCNYGVSATYKS
ncbi:hypothetical protein HDU81_011161 [Chytriomyces hyalinus]|nr:hypothetical protein HDU81_011161 [Chytriomyces hyalinus]